MTAPKPAPRANLIHQQILSGLIETKPVSWQQKTIDPVTDEVVKTTRTGFQLPHTTRSEPRVKNVKRGSDGVYRHDIVNVDVPVPTLAGNVSALNVEIAARRWMR
ncbi:hypothetical protein [Mycobacterium paragordonae]|uniref:Uncharacterized protein n=1 Tax=Mycobacterium paragordonae TaxID=1389713 RepID=A0AAJ1VZA1_9MYCO|nr:hypothetical protein [Mycobacterium paragordonae]MDP7733670.1 hypothetical protein [Mycobacterium paragordonae]